MKYRLWCLAMVVSCYCHAQSAEPEWEKLLVKLKRLETKDPAKAFEGYRQIVTGSYPLQFQSYKRALTSITLLARQDNQRKEVRRLLAIGISRLVGSSGDYTSALLLVQAGRFYDVSENMADSAIACYQQAMIIRSSLFGGQSEAVADCWDGIGAVYKYLSYDFNAAEVAFEKALQIREVLNPINKRMLASTYYNLAVTNRSQHDYEKALDYLVKTISLSESISDEGMLEVAYSGLGNVYRDTHEPAQARIYFQKAINLNLKNAPDFNEGLAANYQNLGSMQMLERDFAAALASFSKAFDIYNHLKRKSLLYINAMQEMGLTYMKVGREEDAMKTYRQALRELSEMNITKGGQAADILRYMGDYFMFRNQPDSSMVYYQKSLHAAVPSFKPSSLEENPTFKDIELKESVFETLLSKGKALRALDGDGVHGKRQAIQCLVLAEQILDYSRRALDMDQSKWSYLEGNWSADDSKFSIYDQLIEVLVGIQEVSSSDSLLEMTFRYMEKSKSKRLADALLLAEGVNPEMFQDTLLQELTQRRSEVLRLTNRLKEETHEDSIRNIRLRIVDLDRSTKTAEEAVRQAYPSYLQVRYDDHIYSIGDIRSYCRRQQAIWIDYFWGVQHVFAMAITENGAKCVRLGQTDALRGSIQQLTSHLEGKASLEPSAPVTFAKVAASLYEDMVSRLVESKNQQRMIIVPDGWIARVPFEALISGPASSATGFKLPYLVYQYSMVYGFSAATILRKSEGQSADPALLAFGYGSGSASTGKTTAIAGTLREIQALQKIFKNGRFLQNEQATESEFKRLASDYDILHVAVHGSADPSRNYSASLYFPTDSTEREDGQLYWYELYAMRLKARLAVLTACESGLGTAYRGEGMMSMANAFVYAGCQSVVMGLWKVGDQFSAQIVDVFYGRLADGAPLDEALAVAKRAYLERADELSSDPRLWSSLIAYGDQPIVQKRDLSIIWVISIGLLIVILIFLKWLRK